MVWTLFSTFCSYSSKILFCILFFGLERVYSLFQYLLYYLDSVNSCRTTHYPNSPQKVSSLFMVFFLTDCHRPTFQTADTGRVWWRQEGGGQLLKGPPSVKALIIMWAALDSITLLFARPGASQPGLLAGCGKVNGGGKTSYCVTLERSGEGAGHLSAQACHTRGANGHGRPEERPQTPIEPNPVSITRGYTHFTAAKETGPWYH